MKLQRLRADEVRMLRRLLKSYLRESASSLAMLLDQAVRLRLSEAKDVRFSSLAEIIGPAANQQFFGVYVKGEGDIHPEMAFFLPPGKAKDLAHQLLRKRVSRLTSMAKSSIAEAGSIMAGSFLNGLSKATGFHVRASPASFGKDLLRVLLELPLVDIAARTDRVFVAIAHLLALRGMDVKLFIMLDPLEARKILRKARNGS